MDKTTDTPNDIADEELSPLDPKDELAMLKERARAMGIPFSNNISIATLRQRINDKLNAEPEATPEQVAVKPVVDKKARQKTLRQRLLDDAMKLVRLRIVNLNPNKRDIPGEVITVGNEYIGTVKKYVPFGEATDEGYHVPYCIYEALKARKYLDIRTREKDNQIRIERRWVREFALEVLPPLTKDELRKLAVAQMAAAGGE